MNDDIAATAGLDALTLQSRLSLGQFAFWIAGILLGRCFKLLP
jgi:hypothetical protein